MKKVCQRQNKSCFLKSLILNKPIKKLRKLPDQTESMNEMTPTVTAKIITKTEDVLWWYAKLKRKL